MRDLFNLQLTGWINEYKRNDMFEFEFDRFAGIWLRVWRFNVAFSWDKD